MNNLIEKIQVVATKKRMWAIVFVLVFVCGTVLAVSLVFKKPTARSTNNSPMYGPCTSEAGDTVETIDNWKVTLYAGPLESNTPEVSRAVDVKTFSLKGIKEKSEKYSFYARFELADGSYLTGYDTSIEFCDAQNRTNDIYRVTKRGSDRVVDDNRISARMHYLHAGDYVFETGTFRADAYVKTLDGKWHLVGRVTDLVITE
jgi:hypothetical protein